ncbi:NAD(P)/FAD-dependent oxidoreductase [Herbidospora sp. RD11066]
MNVKADIAVVGAGVIGSSIAFELAKSGRSVVVVDKAGAPGQGSTSASSAVIRFNYSGWDSVALSWESRHCWEKWADHVEAADLTDLARFHRTGMVFLDVDIAPMDRVLGMFERAGIPYEAWDADELARRVPTVDPGRFWPPKRIDDPEFWEDTDRRLGALWTPDAGFVDDPALAAVNLADAARRRGARFLFGRRVVAVPDGGVLLDDGTTISAPIVVNAAGPWSGRLNELAGVGAGWSVTVRPMRQEVHHVPAPAGYNDGGIGPVIADLDLGVYLRGTPGDGLLVGGTEPECDGLDWIDDPDTVDLNPTRKVFDAQVTRTARRLPDLGVPARPIGIAGVYDVTEDWSPIYDATEREGFYVAIGTSGNQFKNAPMAGRLMRAVIEGESHVVGEHTGLEIALAPFGRSRPRNADSTGTVLG